MLDWYVFRLAFSIFLILFSTAIPTAAASPSKLFHSAMNKSSTVKAFVGYTISASVITCVHILTAETSFSMIGHDSRLSLFVKSRCVGCSHLDTCTRLTSVSRKHPFYLNGRLIYFVTCQLAISALATFRNMQLDRFAVRWTGALSVVCSRLRNAKVATELIACHQNRENEAESRDNGCCHNDRLSPNCRRI